jgi:hypothetical protein
MGKHTIKLKSEKEHKDNCLNCGAKISKKTFKINDGLCTKCFKEDQEEAPAGWEAYGLEYWND